MQVKLYMRIITCLQFASNKYSGLINELNFGEKI